MATQPIEASSSQPILRGQIVVLENFSQPWHINNPPNHDIDDSSYLCNVCRRIDFQYLVHHHNRGTGLETGIPQIQLGFLRDINQKSSCAFCRLVVAAAKLPYEPLKTLEFTDPDGGEVMCQLSLSKRLLMGEAATQPNILGITMRYQYQDPDQLGPDKLIEDYPIIELGPITSGLSFFKQSKRSWRPLPKRKMNSDLASEWLLFCDEYVDDSNEDESAIFHESISYLRVIDVEQCCVVKAPPQCRFVALSYVWGGFPQLQYTKASASMLEQPDGINVSELPRTISTALKLVARLGERYLWVDALCILQDDAEDKKAQIAAMDRIYGSAVLTIAAAAASNADSPLPGVCKWSRQAPQHIEKIQGMQLANILPDLEETLRKSKWNSRGWTYQERVLSRRTLFVTSSQLFFECSFGVFAESLGVPERPNVANRQHSGRLSWKNSVNFTLYAAAVEAFSKRNLSFDTDVLDAFEGVSKRLRHLFRGKLSFGMPETEMECALRWEPFTVLQRRKHPTTREDLFPSWSWAGWKGHVRYFHEEEISVLTWLNEDEQEINSHDFRCPNAKLQGTDTPWVYQPRNLSRDIFSHSSYINPDIPGYRFRHPVEPENERPTALLLKPGLPHLRFWTLSAAMFLKDYDRGGDMLYQINLRMCVLSASDGKENGQAGTIKVSYTLKDGLYEFIALSRAKGHQSERQDFHEDPMLIDPKLLENITTEQEKDYDFKGNNFDKRYLEYDPIRFDSEKFWPVYNVLMIEWRDGIAYRLGVGKIHVDAFHRANAMRKLIVLG